MKGSVPDCCITDKPDDRENHVDHVPTLFTCTRPVDQAQKALASSRFPTTFDTFDGRVFCDGHAAASAAPAPSAFMSLLLFGCSKDISSNSFWPNLHNKIILKIIARLGKGMNLVQCVYVCACVVCLNLLFEKMSRSMCTAVLLMMCTQVGLHVLS